MNPIPHADAVLKTTLAGAALACAPVCFAAPAAAPAKKPDILVIFTDQWSPRETPRWNTAARTPNLDAIAREGMRFNAAYSNCPVCMPARVCVLTGQFPHNTNLWGNTMRFAPLVSQAKLFSDMKDAGYSTAQIGKLHWTSGDAFREQGFANVRALYDALKIDHAEDISSPFATQSDKGAYGQYLKNIGKLDAYAADMKARLNGDNFLVKPSVASAAEHNEAFLTDRAVAYIQAQPTDTPMFLVVSYFGPHNPMDAPEPYASMYDPARLDPPPNVSFPYKYDGVQIDRARWQKIKANYLGKISYIDACVGRLVAALKARGKWDDTYVVFLADHGEMMGAQGCMTKGRFFEESVGVPLFVRPPKGAKAAAPSSDTPVQISDVYATVVEAAGGTPTPQRFSKSLLPLVYGRERAGDRAAFSEIRNGGQLAYMVRKGDYKWFAQRGREHLYNLKDDPYETRNLIDDPAHAETLADLREALRCWQMQTQIDYSAGYKPMAQRAREAAAKAAAKNGAKK